MAEKPKVTDYEQPAYQSQYQGQLDSALNTVTNREKFAYDPLKDANYQALAKLYQKQGAQAAQNTMGDAAALNGGYGSSFAVTASQQARNDFNQQLASQIPALSDAAYNKYINENNLNIAALDALRAADESAYGRHRDTVGDSQWRYGVDYQGYRDDVGDQQWKTQYNRGVYESDRSYNYQTSRDKVTDSQWAQEFALAKKRAASSGAGNGGVNYRGGTNDDAIFQALLDAANDENKKKNKTNGKSTNAGSNSGITNSHLQRRGSSRRGPVTSTTNKKGGKR